ncbi:multiple epidermal growth factor-like domains protein 10 [Saccostrea echinata]|uniref:multiple epidermal growth factor-like domains protein 10 n=1 Tax=Saccostrea echinata TaxID=191078 RepID=UPI002A81DFEA|nr:multiple epidermal growth factor-like domains protein 10 [Saccostrea echinata]
MQFDENGICTRGCIEGYWGDKCLNDCPSTCPNIVCNRTSGLCGSCRDGYYGNRCEYHCHWKNKCSERKCNEKTGYCTSGCVSGYFGVYCQHPCGNCSSGTCDKISGNCEACNTGYYGTKCERKCSYSCFNHECRQINGHCTNGCNNGFYGSFCNSQCSENCAQTKCTRSGVCIGGCKPNWTGDKCDRCESQHYGPDCSQVCSVNCKRQACDNITGSCTYGCKTGFYSDKCEKSCRISCLSTFNSYSGEYEGECPIGKYGTYCNKTCNDNCINGCIKINGSCNFGCIPGKFGTYCLQTCGEGCVSGCRQADGSCTCKSGWQGHQCGEIKQTIEKCSKPDIYLALYGIITTLFISIFMNIVLIVRNTRRNVSNKEKQDTCQRNSTLYANTMYDRVEDNTGYQNLGQLSQPSHYDELK